MDEKRTIRVGTIGCGSHSGMHIHPSLAFAGLELVACCDLDERKAERFAQRYGQGKYYTDYRKMCDSERLDGVIVVVGPQAHYELSLELLDRGCNVWTEKPPAPSADLADEVAARARKTGKFVQTGYNYRYTAAVRAAREMIAQGRFASPATVCVRWRLGEEDATQFLLHYVCHAVDLLAYLVGPLANPVVRGLHKDSKTYCVATFDTPADCLAVLELSNNMPLTSPWARVDWLSRSGLMSAVDFNTLELYPCGDPWPRFPDDRDRYERLPANQWWCPPLLGGPLLALDHWGYIPELDLFRRAVIGEVPPDVDIEETAQRFRLAEMVVEQLPD